MDGELLNLECLQVRATREKKGQIHFLSSVWLTVAISFLVACSANNPVINECHLITMLDLGV